MYYRILLEDHLDIPKRWDYWYPRPRVPTTTLLPPLPAAIKPKRRAEPLRVQLPPKEDPWLQLARVRTPGSMPVI